jgi:hypothetical protein
MGDPANSVPPRWSSGPGELTVSVFHPLPSAVLRTDFALARVPTPRPGVVSLADERRSLAISSNLHPSGFDEVMANHRRRDGRPARAPRPRRAHAADSIRLTQAIGIGQVIDAGSRCGSLFRAVANG